MKKLFACIIILGAALSLTLLADPKEKNSQDLTGSWRIRVVIPSGSSACAAGTGPCVFLALANASSDGTLIQTAALPATSTGHGVWKRTGLRQFTTYTTYFRLNAQGFPIGTAETQSTIELSKDGKTASGVYVNSVLDLDGNEVTSFTAAVSATRFTP